MSKHPPKLLRPLALALHLAFLGAAGTTLALPATARAQEAAFDFAIPAGPLQNALTAFSAQTRINVSFTPEIAGGGKHSPGVQGSHTAAQALARLLVGSGLVAVRQGNGFTLEQAPSGGDVTLTPVTVSASADRSGTTERTGSYTQRGPNRTATGLGLTLRDTPQSVTVVTRQQMDDQGLTTLTDTLERTVGITMNQYESNRTLPSARGFEITKIRHDGVSSSDNGFGFSNDWFSDNAIYDRVEIVRGAAGLLSGTGEPSAAINLVRKKPTREFQGHAQLSAGSWDAYRGEIDLSGPLAAEGKIRGRLVATHADRKSYLDYYDKRSTGVYGVLEADLPADMLFTLGVDYHDSLTRGATYGAPVPMYYADGSRTNFSRSTTTAADWTYIDSERLASFASLEKRFANGWQARLQYSYRKTETTPKLRTLEGVFDRETGAGSFWLGGMYYDIDKQEDTFDLSASGPFTLLGREHELMLGYSHYQYDESRLFYERLPVPPLDSYYNQGSYPYPQFGTVHRTDNPIYIDHREKAAYVASRLSLADPLKLILGARLTNVDYSLTNWGVTSTARYHQELTPYAGLIYDVSDNYSAYASYADIFNTQTVRDRNGALLDPIIGTNYEAGLKGSFHGGRLNVSAAIFKVKQDNLAEFDAIIDSEYRYKAVDGTTTRGYELEVSGEPLRGWNVAGGFTRRISKDGDGSAVQTIQPQNLLRLSTSYRLPGEWNRWTLGGHLSWQSRIYEKDKRPGGGDTEQASYALVHAFASYQAGKDLSLQMNINNLFDKKYYTGFYNNYGRYGDPRSFTLTARYTF
ncbi:TonB-dependent siderophore receptor [Pseudothauera nasutitermitis]|nr:TonB-dependent receptor [Pseudothauera nasutitermitis]